MATFSTSPPFSRVWQWAILLLCAMGASADVIVLNDSNFEHQTQASTGQTTGKWFVMFSAPWCGRACSELKPTLTELSKYLAMQDDGSSVLVATVDTLENRDLADRFTILSQPTFIFFADRQMYKYRGMKTFEAMKEFVQGGYKEKPALPVPKPPSFIDVTRRKLELWVEETPELRYLREDFEHIVEMRKNAAVVLMLMGAVVGMLLTCIMGCLCGGSSKKKSKEKQG